MGLRFLLVAFIGLLLSIPDIRPATAGDASPGKIFQDCPDCPQMVVVPAGGFRMGSPAAESGRAFTEGPVHEVEIRRPFALGRFEVTRGQFAAFVAATGFTGGVGCYWWTGDKLAKDDENAWRDPAWWTGDGWFPDVKKGWRDPGYRQGDDEPVACVNWADAEAYIDWLGRRAGFAYRLPTAAEWEYAARAGSTAARPWKDEAGGACAHANVHDRASRARLGPSWRHHDCDDGFARTSSVGRFPANAFGLHDMLGNVWEWTADCWHDDYTGAPADGRAWTAGGDCARRVLRGGSWSALPRQIRFAARIHNTPTTRLWNPNGYRSDSGFGFRVARDLVE